MNIWIYVNYSLKCNRDNPIGWLLLQTLSTDEINVRTMTSLIYDINELADIDATKSAQLRADMIGKIDFLLKTLIGLVETDPSRAAEIGSKIRDIGQLRNTIKK